VTATINSPNYSGTGSGTLVINPAPVEPPVSTPGSTIQISATDSGIGSNGHWQRNGAALPNGSGAILNLPDAQPPIAGLYTYTGTVNGGGSVTTEPVIVGITTTQEVVGSASQVGEGILHPNGNVYDQVLLEGNGATVTAEPSRITRISFVDLNGDIVQVELSGAGTLSLVMDDASTPAPAANYEQPSVDYVRGHAGVVITGANETTNVTIFTVGRNTALNQSLFKDEVEYDAVADIAFLAIQSSNGKFGGIRTGNVNYFATQGFTGIYAPGVEVTGPMNIGDVTAYDSATPVLVVGEATNARIAGGNLEQPNGQPIQTAGLTHLEFVTGTNSQGDALPAQTIAGKLVENGVDVTNIVAPPKS
jgi:hypothetical protein